MKKLILILGVVLLMTGVAQAKPDLMGPVHITIRTTEPDYSVDRYGYHITKLMNYSFPFSGNIYLYWANPAPHGNVPPTVHLDLSAPSECGLVTIGIECRSENGALVTASANNTKVPVNDKFVAYYNCSLTLNDFDDFCHSRSATTNVVQIYANGTSRREKGDLTDTITQIKLSGCRITGGGGAGFDSVFNGTFSSTLLP